MSEKQVLSEAARQAKREYGRAWRAKNKDSVRASNARYWERRAAREAEREGKQDVGSDAND